ncbi:putative dual-specificity kinase [Helianthus annuus]|uniref:Dual-specificity kinase n=1 Tax=Helianthus annuus TaxID=4232 RepID=A0A9K3J4G5_HELAN|nr:putative dual-specificity kinase [Helianthus annuus]
MSQFYPLPLVNSYLTVISRGILENILLVSPEYIKVPDYKGSSRSPKDSSYSKRIPRCSAIKVIDFGWLHNV